MTELCINEVLLAKTWKVSTKKANQKLRHLGFVTAQ
jgi:hypothetical protein